MSRGIKRFFLLFFFLAYCWPGFNASNLRIVKQWAELEFNFPNAEAEAIAREKRFYVPGKSLPIDVDVQHRKGSLPSRIFITIPRFDDGRPVTLGTVDPQGKISGYPNYAWNDNQGHNCEGLTSVFRVVIDKCKRLWVMDTGKIGTNQACPPQLLAFNLKNDQLIYRHVLDESKYVSTSLFVTPAVDVRGSGRRNCGDTFVYVADAVGSGLVVVDVAKSRSWRLNHSSFLPNPNRGIFTIDGESFELNSGIFGMALSPYQGPGMDRRLYFHALASTTENYVPTSFLRDDSYVYDSNLDPESVCLFENERPNQSAAEAMDRDGVLYFGLMEPPGIWCWNSSTEYSERNFHQVAVDRETLQFASGVKIVNNIKGEQELWVLTSSFQRFMTGSMMSDRINFRIHSENISWLRQNSPQIRVPFERHPGYFTNYQTNHKNYNYGHP